MKLKLALLALLAAMVVTGCTGGPTVTVNTPKAGSAPPKEVEDTKTTNTLGQAAQAGTE